MKKVIHQKKEKLLAELHTASYPCFWDKSSVTKLLKSQWKKGKITNCSAVVTLRGFVSMLLCSSNTIQGNHVRCSWEGALLVYKPVTCFWTHIWILFYIPYRHIERCYVKYVHSVENVLECSGTVIMNLQLNSDLVFNAFRFSNYIWKQ